MWVTRVVSPSLKHKHGLSDMPPSPSLSQNALKKIEKVIFYQLIDTVRGPLAVVQQKQRHWVRCGSGSVPHVFVRDPCGRSEAHTQAHSALH